MRGMAAAPHGFSRALASALMLLMLFGCGPRTTLNRTEEGPQEASDSPLLRADPQVYEVEGHGTVRFYGRTWPDCPFDTIRTVMTAEEGSYERAAQALIDLVIRDGGRAVIRFEAETLAVNTVDKRAHSEMALTDPIRDANGRVIGQTQRHVGHITPAESSFKVTYKLHGIVVRYRDGDCGSKT